MKAIIVSNPNTIAEQEYEKCVEEANLWALDHGIGVDFIISTAPMTQADIIAKNIELLHKADAIIIAGPYKTWKLTSLYQQLAKHMGKITLYHNRLYEDED